MVGGDKTAHPFPTATVGIPLTRLQAGRGSANKERPVEEEEKEAEGI